MPRERAVPPFWYSQIAARFLAMTERLILRGYQYSVYNRIVRIVLHEKGVEYEIEEIDPFQPKVSKDYLRRHPFGRVPVLSHGKFDVYETAAICRYVEAAFNGLCLLPTEEKALARVAQVVSIADNYGYRPMVRQVYEHRVFRPSVGEPSDEAEIADGLDTSLLVLEALDALASEGYVLDGKVITLADCHLAPMVAYFVQAEEGAKALASYSALADWWASLSQRRSILETNPGTPPKHS